jgi:hypothetical protein
MADYGARHFSISADVFLAAWRRCRTGDLIAAAVFANHARDRTRWGRGRSWRWCGPARSDDRSARCWFCISRGTCGRCGGRDRRGWSGGRRLHNHRRLIAGICGQHRDRRFSGGLHKAAACQNDTADSERKSRGHIGDKFTHHKILQI